MRFKGSNEDTVIQVKLILLIYHRKEELGNVVSVEGTALCWQTRGKISASNDRDTVIIFVNLNH